MESGTVRDLFQDRAAAVESLADFCRHRDEKFKSRQMLIWYEANMSCPYHLSESWSWWIVS